MRYDRERAPEYGRSVLDRLRSGEAVLALGIRHSRTGDICRMASGAGYGLVWVDLEHSSMSIDAAAQIAATGHDLGLGAWARVPERDHAVIGRLLDGGVGGIIAPKIERADEARELAAACRFPPAGRRSMLARLPRDGYVRIPPHEFVATANREVVVQALIESPEGVENAGAIAAVEGVDMLAVGTNDLTAEMGCPGEVNHPAVMAACARVAEAAARNGKTAVIGGVADDAHFLALTAMGFARLIFAGIDTDLMAEVLAQRAAAWRAKLA
jgi:2-keto-3-deoxy-L-rhamnonate aldolase RhmA